MRDLRLPRSELAEYMRACRSGYCHVDMRNTFLQNHVPYGTAQSDRHRQTGASLEAFGSQLFRILVIG